MVGICLCGIPTVFGRVSWVGLALLGPNGKYDAIFTVCDDRSGGKGGGGGKGTLRASSRLDWEG